MNKSQAQNSPIGVRSPEFGSHEHEQDEEQQSKEHERDEERQREGFDHSELPTQMPSDQMPRPLGGSTQSTKG